MNERIDFADSVTPSVSVWTPWGEQKVRRSEGRAALMRRVSARMRGSEELPSVPDFSERPWPVG